MMGRRDDIRIKGVRRWGRVEPLDRFELERYQPATHRVVIRNVQGLMATESIETIRGERYRIVRIENPYRNAPPIEGMRGTKRVDPTIERMSGLFSELYLQELP